MNQCSCDALETKIVCEAEAAECTRLGSYKATVVDVAGDGNCGFR